MLFLVDDTPAHRLTTHHIDPARPLSSEKLPPTSVELVEAERGQPLQLSLDALNLLRDTARNLFTSLRSHTLLQARSDASPGW